MELTLQAEIREEKGTGAAHRLRREGFIPAVVYSKAGSEPLRVSSRETERLVGFAGTGRLVSLAIKRGKKTVNTPVLIKELQRNPVRGEIIHIDFHAVALDKAIVTHVPIHLTGEEKRLNDGSIIELFLRAVEVTCLPTEIPAGFTVDVSGLTRGVSIHVRDLTPPAGVKLVTPSEEAIVTASVPTVVAEPEPVETEEEEAETVAEPEKEKAEEK